MPLKIIRQDITKMQVDAIVNTTNENMTGYSGVDLAVHTAAGRELDEFCATLEPLGLGEAKVTPAFRLNAKYIIHTSGPVWQGGLQGESIILKSCYTEALRKAVEYGCESVAFPLISSGAYGYPKDKVLRFAVEVITEFLFENELTVYLCVYDRTSYEFSRKLFCDISSFLSENEADELICFSEAMPKEARCEPMPFFRREMPDFSVGALPACAGAPAPRKKAEKADSIGDMSFEEYMKSMDKDYRKRGKK